jgi:type VI secretion system secreted protein VgrG
MAEFARALPVVAAHEGSAFVNDPADPGGPTKCGITLGWAVEHHLDVDHDGDVDIADIRGLTWELAAPRYKAEIWDELGLDAVVCQDVATKLLDLAVNLGPTRAVRYFQRALNLCRYQLAEDGRLGPLTLGALNDAQPRELLLAVSGIQAAHYRAWVERKPEREKFRKGLLARAAWPYIGRAALIA